jgi:hypothetical protein
MINMLYDSGITDAPTTNVFFAPLTGSLVELNTRG